MARRKRKLGSNIAMYLMLAPYMSLLILFGVVPIIMAVLEVPHESRVNPDGGWDAFKIVLQDFRFLPALKNVLGFMAIFVPLTTVFVIAVALMLDMNPSKWKKWLRLSYIVPASISGAVSVLVWYVIFAPSLSPVKSVLNAIGIEKSEEIWQTKNLIWLFAIMAFFAVAGNWILIQFGSLQSISSEIIEAARMDGCSAFRLPETSASSNISVLKITISAPIKLGTSNIRDSADAPPKSPAVKASSNASWSSDQDSAIPA